jgi:hypothetical protein
MATAGNAPTRLDINPQARHQPAEQILGDPASVERSP